jgi:ABC-type multidrug transport system fused ATPase/permease subunit
MDAFWQMAARMGRYRAMLAGGILFAVLSAGGLGAGLLGLGPILEIVLKSDSADRPDLPSLAADLNQNLPAGLEIPQAWIDQLPSGPMTALTSIVVALGILTVIGGAANFFHQYLALAVVLRTITNIRREAFHRVIRFPLGRVVAGGTSDMVSRIVNDSSALGAGFTALVSKALAQSLKGFFAFVAAIIFDWRVVLVAVPLALVLGVVIQKLGKRIRRASRSALESQAGLYGAASEALQGLRVVKVHTTERYEAGRFHRRNKEVMRQLLRARTARALSSPLVEVIAILVLGAVSLVAANFIIRGDMAPAAFAGAMGALFAAGASLKPLSGLINDIKTSSPAAERLSQLLAGDPEPGHSARLPKIPRHQRNIAFDDVSFTYPGAPGPVLNEINLRVEHGQTVAIVGPNGSGKTTLLALVPRLFDPDPPEPSAPGKEPEGGRVLIDGHNLREYSVRSLRRQIGVVTQETVIFSGTIRSNIAYGAESVTEQRIIDAAKKARAHEFIEQMPRGYDTVVGEQGLTLSGGQRQRLAIARAVLRNPAILILDEATSMIDADSEAKIAEAIADFTKGRTCLIVAHRLSTVVGADRIVVMDQGRIVDEGTHEQLLDRCETYRLIARTQLVSGTLTR